MANKTLSDIVLSHFKRRDMFARLFMDTFNTPITRFFHPMFGFDVIRFDDWLAVPDGVSTREYVASKYGDAAVKLVESLIGNKEETNDIPRTSSPA